MKAVQLLDRMVLSEDVAQAPEASGISLNIAGVYQDGLTRDWAMQTCRVATQLAAEWSFLNKWYDTRSLGDHGILSDAVHAALAADVIVVSVYAAEELPLDLYVWFQAWLPRRASRVGALTALIGVAEPLDFQFVRTVEYLRAVAHRGKLDFSHLRRALPA
jgi:hypothetical protein